jgi:hypothetical protein
MTMNPYKIAVICCTNNPVEFMECQTYIQALELPDNFHLEIIPIYGAPGMAAGYNEAMRLTDAKYKVYLHQDTFIVHRGFFTDLIQLFEQNANIGLVGVIGAKYLPESGIWWESAELTGKVYNSSRGRMDLLDFGSDQQSWSEVEAIDGLLIATQADLPWREDLFDGWHFYDTSQCMEYIRAGYAVAVPSQDIPWCLHDCGVTHTGANFQEARKLFCSYYRGGSARYSK